MTKKRMAWLREEWLAGIVTLWDSPADLCGFIVFRGVFADPYDAETFAALEQTWAIWQGLA